MDRRGFLTQAPLIAAAGAISARDLASRPGGLTRVSNISGNAGCSPIPCNPGDPPSPNMPREAAFRLLYDSPSIRREVRERLVQEARYAVTLATIDPDIAILKSVSPMAKLFLARQRYVEVSLKKAMNEQNSFFTNGHGPVQDFLSQKAHDLMWGEKSLLSSILGT